MCDWSDASVSLPAPVMSLQQEWRKQPQICRRGRQTIPEAVRPFLSVVWNGFWWADASWKGIWQWDSYSCRLDKNLHTCCTSTNLLMDLMDKLLLPSVVAPDSSKSLSVLVQRQLGQARSCCCCSSKFLMPETLCWNLCPLPGCMYSYSFACLYTLLVASSLAKSLFCVYPCFFNSWILFATGCAASCVEFQRFGTSWWREWEKPGQWWGWAPASDGPGLRQGPGP